MEAFDPAMFPSGCYLVPRVAGLDPDAGPTASFPSPGPALPCRVRYEKPRPGMMGSADTGTSPCWVALPADPGARLDDQVLVVAPGKVLRVLASAQPRDGEGRLFVLPCEAVD